MITTTLPCGHTEEQELALQQQWETGRVTIRSHSGQVLRHIFSGRRIGKTACGRYDVAIADVQVDDERYGDCGACTFADAGVSGEEYARRKAGRA